MSERRRVSKKRFAILQEIGHRVMPHLQALAEPSALAQIASDHAAAPTLLPHLYLDLLDRIKRAVDETLGTHATPESQRAAIARYAATPKGRAAAERRARARYFARRQDIIDYFLYMTGLGGSASRTYHSTANRVIHLPGEGGYLRPMVIEVLAAEALRDAALRGRLLDNYPHQRDEIIAAMEAARDAAQAEAMEAQRTREAEDAALEAMAAWREVPD